MRKLLLSLLSLVVMPVLAANTTTTVTQVTTAVTLGEDVDYHITSTTPFTTTGSIDITNIDHAVVILDNLRPSLAAKQLGFITINGAKAVNGSNCQVKMYNNGAIIFPYPSSMKPLTVYSEENFGGESCNEFGLESSGGFMNTLTAAKLNNRIKSFKLKRGYMVTFAIGESGRGYSRCFVADKEDLELATLPNILKGRISSYRVFKWNDFSKKGLASDTRYDATQALNVQACYSWGTGEDRGADCECVPNHIYEDWPSASACGAVTYSAHMKTNNEPGNSADDHPQSVATVLDNWQNLMRTGMRLCSPSSHDGSLGWLREFMDSIDARGWRCDILDMHCYWPEGSFGNLSGWYNSYRRPIWVSEFVWGASWNSNGAFASGVTEQDNKVAMTRILNNLNNWNYVERYFYWNSERDPSKIYKNNGQLTPLGEFYRDMNTGLGYRSDMQYVPRDTRMSRPTGLNIAFNPSTTIATLKWEDANGELNDSMLIERKVEKGAWQVVGRVDVLDGAGSYTFKDTVSTPGNYSYRVHTISYRKDNRYSDEVYNIISGSESSGNGDIQFGTLNALSTDESYNYFSAPYLDQPAVVYGSVTNLNARIALVERVYRVFQQNSPQGKVYTFFRSNLESLPLYTETEYYQKTSPELSPYIIAKSGTGAIGTLPYEAGNIPSVVVGDTATYTFAQPFAQAPVVMATPVYSTTMYPLMWRVFDITPTGFKIVLQRQKGNDALNKSRIKADLSFFAIAKGSGVDGTGKMFTVRDTLVSFTNSSSLKKLEYGETYTNPVVLVQMQTLNKNVAAILRTRPYGPENDNIRVRYQIDNTDTDFTVSTKDPATETIGMIIISDDPDYTSKVESVRQVDEGDLHVYPLVAHESLGVRDDAATSVSLYNMGGQQVFTGRLSNGQATINVSSLPQGIYMVRTNAGHSMKVTKK